MVLEQLKSQYYPKYDDPNYVIPSHSQFKFLHWEIIIMIIIFGLTLIFTIYNTFVFLVAQKRYKNWLVTVFYAFSFMVLIFRICYFSQCMTFFSLLDNLI